MASDHQASARVPPPKPWERMPLSSGPTPFKPPSYGSTRNVVEASVTAKPGETVSTANMNATATAIMPRRRLPVRPWEQQNYTSTYTGYNSGYNSGLCGSSNGGGFYGNNRLNGGVNGRGMYNNGFGGPIGANGRVMPHDGHDPNGDPDSPSAFWVSLLQKVRRVVKFCGNIAMLVDENTRALHIFMSALLMLLDVSGSLYGELATVKALRKLARFVFGILGIRRKPRTAAAGLPPRNGNQRFLEGRNTAADGTSWDSVWER